MNKPESRVRTSGSDHDHVAAIVFTIFFRAHENITVRTLLTYRVHEFKNLENSLL
jgi:hypothetical protein